MVLCNAECAPALPSGAAVRNVTRMKKNGRTVLAMLFAGDLDLSCAVALNPTVDSGEPCAHVPEERPGSRQTQHDHSGGVWKSGLRLQEMWYGGGVGVDDRLPFLESGSPD